MKTNLLLPSLLALALAAAGTARAAVRTDLIGEPAPLSAATRTVWIQPGTRWVNVTGGEVVKFVVGDRAFAWNFNGADLVRGFDLSQIAPRGMLSQPVRGYVAANPLYVD
ncbi:CzcE family metal-binding protein [Janthinobacterium fluminis]|uniref:CzcE family metal-binding protein n=1 Tax=Janthinobacterium fluminis TaxID=2987524 RepID=A0ABT5K790_9BURK|nr:CzcE family metal-binding protein [Janthinobacterium fluminis]MDC8759911.1 CzcE family metal-binding protein [Janthinobacterium fluminis]